MIARRPWAAAACAIGGVVVAGLAAFAQEAAAPHAPTAEAPAATPVAGAPAATPDPADRRLVDAIDPKRLVLHVKVLAGEDFAGRGAGSDGGALAAAYMEREFRAAGLRPAIGDASFRQRFASRAGTLVNIVGRLHGSDAALAAEVVVLGAHFDHLGRVGETVYPGADDNASGCAALIEIARAFRSMGTASESAKAAWTPRRSVVFVAFDGEERGLLGSRHFMDDPPLPKERIVAMVNLDMISRGDPGDVWLSGPAWSKEMKAHVTTFAPLAELTPRFAKEREWRRSSDHSPFGDARIPFTYLGVLDHADYHRPTDTADKIDATLMLRITRLAALIVKHVADANARPTFAE